MYQAFKRRMLEEMAIRRDMVVLQYQEPSYERIFAVATANDKLYSRILDEFDRMAECHVADLLYSLCLKHGINAQRRDINAPFDLLMEVDGKERYVELKAGLPPKGSAIMTEYVKKVQKWNKPVSLVFLIKNDMRSCDALDGCFPAMLGTGIHIDFQVVLFERFLQEQFGDEELLLFKKAMQTYQEEMHQAIGYQITEILNANNLAQLRTDLEKEILHFPFDRIKNERFLQLQSKDSSFRDLDAEDFENMKDLFLNQNRYKLLLGERDFAISFLTSEWLYKKYFAFPEMDNTFIVAGYLKSIEQLLWDIIQYVGHGRRIKGVTIEEGNEDRIDKTLGTLEHFITNSSNEDLFTDTFGDSKEFIMEYLGRQLQTWRRKYRNGYFHKHCLVEKDRIDAIREETLFLHLLILGMISLDQNAITLLS